jgi:hypothetical protein
MRPVVRTAAIGNLMAAWMAAADFLKIGLVKLYRATDDPKYLNLARFLISGTTRFPSGPSLPAARRDSEARQISFEPRIAWILQVDLMIVPALDVVDVHVGAVREILRETFRLRMVTERDCERAVRPRCHRRRCGLRAIPGQNWSVSQHRFGGSAEYREL